ncbi:MogA/MoaB family molybdenum cofactor biosynthesis protein [Acanthopleuribacter pedis]|uniref:Molybdenum cofactor biosynthesis protein B n=1 Tax=Acanthopleuribacter pedis TaxID=442870 RepID=A0A8J7QNB0_9BACT|nr:molybdenum cofactor synthesis domain-containing protein [Acanthopleuribacter pedis]MBO1321160.1 molybdenum cofactor biosynthesis protein [Acanthopleuribacter pedis]
MPHHDTHFRPAATAVITVSDTRTEATDTSGKYLADTLRQKGHQVVHTTLVKDEPTQIRAAVQQRLDARDCSYILLTGGTGLTPRDATPEAVSPLFDKEIPGFGELFRFLSYKDIGTATIQSRATAGLCGETVVFLLPGSTGACRLALEKIILPQIDNTTRPCNFRGTIPDPS